MDFRILNNSNILMVGLISAFFISSSCRGGFKSTYVWTPSAQQTPPVPDYANADHWAALPTKKDLADGVPSQSGGFNNQEKADFDIFFIHPTSYLQQTEKSTGWN
ncbi:MAG: hypothetical protein ACK5DJ_03180, partial [Bacteroidota bacterium]